ncbi:MAG: hypothetical protein K2O91_15010 [Lachnospiraceae bacterium]|nr:hypothetical protein [Lachnospiraceae bacterium]
MERTNEKINGYNDTWSLDGLSCRRYGWGSRYFPPKIPNAPYHNGF